MNGVFVQLDALVAVTTDTEEGMAMPWTVCVPPLVPLPPDAGAPELPALLDADVPALPQEARKQVTAAAHAPRDNIFHTIDAPRDL